MYLLAVLISYLLFYIFISFGIWRGDGDGCVCFLRNGGGKKGMFGTLFLLFW